jgi:hypothetical protein
MPDPTGVCVSPGLSFLELLNNFAVFTPSRVALAACRYLKQDQATMFR